MFLCLWIEYATSRIKFQMYTRFTFALSKDACWSYPLAELEHFAGVVPLNTFPGDKPTLQSGRSVLSCWSLVVLIRWDVKFIFVRWIKQSCCGKLPPRHSVCPFLPFQLPETSCQNLLCLATPPSRIYGNWSSRSRFRRAFYPTVFLVKAA